MTERSHHELERELAELRKHVVFPPTPDLTALVRSAIAAGPAPVAQPRSWRRPLLLTAAALLALIASSLLVPEVRDTVARWLGVDGIRIVIDDEEPTVTPEPVGSRLLFGSRTTFDDAQAAVPYPIHVPDSLGVPDEVYLRQLSDGPMVTLLYFPDDDLPDVGGSGVGAILMQFPGTSHPGDLAKRVSMGRGNVTEWFVGEQRAFWLTGETQLLLDQDPSEDFMDFIARDSANVLIWADEELTYRLELDADLDTALQIARSLEVPATPVP